NRAIMHDLGQGYVAQVCGLLAAFRPDLHVEILNRGNGGDRTIELMERWQVDCIDLKPDWLSVFIGVNDVWRKRSEMQGGQRFVPLAEFVANYHVLLDQVAAAGIHNLVLVSPTLIDKYLQSDLNLLLSEYDAAVQDLSREYNAIYVPLRERLLDLLPLNNEINWLGDGCHPTAAGHAVFAASWLEAVSKNNRV
ncbi:MAG: SGNH/GDSL hydrolase family protein, partial [Kiritimatiellia bacterium]